MANPSETQHGHAVTATSDVKIRVHPSFEPKTSSWQYIVADTFTSIAAIIDPVLDFDPITRTISTQTADSLLRIIRENGYKVDKIIETHVHADHITAASYLKQKLSEIQGDSNIPNTCIGRRITQVQDMFGPRYNVPVETYHGVFDKLLDDDEVFHIGSLEAQAIHLPGHTPDHMGYKIGDNIFVGDSIFQPDLGSARADFPGGNATSLFISGRKLLSHPDHTKIWVGHDYPPADRDAPQPYMLVGHHREHNKHLKDGTTMTEYVELRQTRDATLSEPKLIHHALQFNIRGGRLPVEMSSGLRMVHLPLNLGGLVW